MGEPTAAHDARLAGAADVGPAVESVDLPDEPAEWPLPDPETERRPIRSHRSRFQTWRWRSRLLVLVAILLVLATGVLVAQASSDPASPPPSTLGPRINRTGLVNDGPSLSPPLPVTASAELTAEASGSPSPEGTQSTAPATVAPAPTSGPTTAPPPAPTTPPAATTPAFTPVTLEAEAGVLSGIAVPVACASCSGGKRVGWIHPGSAVVLRTYIDRSGTRTVRITYSTDAPRGLATQVNGVQADVRAVIGTSFDIAQTYQFTVFVTAGWLELRFFYDAGYAPDIDKVDIS